MNIGLIAHDTKKALMENFCIAYRHILVKHDVFATGTTGRRVEDAAGLPVHKLLAGQLGGTSQLCAQIMENGIDLVIFLRDPHHRPSEPSISNVMEVCDERNVPLASNLATAEALLLSLERGDLDWRNVIRRDTPKADFLRN